MHAQTAHMINIYELSAEGAHNNNSIGHNNNNNNNNKANCKELSIGLSEYGADLSDSTMLSPRSTASKEVSNRV